MEKMNLRIFGMVLLLFLPVLSGCSAGTPTFTTGEGGTEVVESASFEGAEETSYEEVCEDESAVTSETSVSGENPASEDTGTVTVYVCGAVMTPGLYELPEGSRIAAAVEAAGGLTEEARTDAVNQADWLTDGQMIYIPKMGEAYEPASSGAEESSQDGKVSINRGTKEELMRLPGIGETKAEAIIAYRESHGGFASKEDLMQIAGIKEGTYQKLEAYITLE